MAVASRSMPGMVVCGVIGPLIFWPTFRLRGSFFAIATLAFNEVGMAFALEMSSRGYVIESGQIVKAGSGQALLEDPDIQRAYMGL